ncbi:MAG: ABC-type bacteriocin/lantibiotic exporter with double-glycine peptidase domain, partial [Neolewinella sp.]
MVLGAIILAVLEMIGVVSVLPFMSLMGRPALIIENPQLNGLFRWGGFTSNRSFIIAAGVTVIVLLTLSRLFAILMNFITESLLWRIYYRTSTRLLDYYISRPYRYFLSRNTADLRVYILREIHQLITGYLSPVITLVISGITSLTIVALILVVNPLVALTSAIVLGGAYLLIYQVRKRPLLRLGNEMQAASRRRHRTLEELLQGIKTVKTYGSEGSFLKQYQQDTETLARVTPRLRLMYQTPKFL